MSFSFRTKIDVPTIAATIKYMEENGWHKIESKYPNALVFHGPLDIYGKPLLLAIPAHENLVDAELRLNDAMRTLAVLNATTPEKMAQTITAENGALTPKPKPTLRRKRPAPAKLPVKAAQTVDA